MIESDGGLVMGETGDKRQIMVSDRELVMENCDGRLVMVLNDGDRDW